MLAGAVFSLADSLAPLLPYVPDGLATDRAKARLLHLARALPSVHRALLECRFDAPDLVDLSIGVLNKPQETGPLNAALSRMRGSEKGWQRLDRFVQHWATPNGSEDHIWLEFDLDRGGWPVPSVFLSNAPGTTFKPLDCLRAGSAEHAAFWSRQLPEGASLDFVGVMLPRAEPGLRLNLSGLSADTAWNWLQHHGNPLPAKAQTDFATVFASGKVIMMVETVQDRLGARVGLECRPQDSVGNQKLFNLCQSRGLCQANAMALADTWPGTLSPLSKTQEFPPAMILDAILSDRPDPMSLLRHINHLKVTFDTKGTHSAKLYLGYGHTNAEMRRGLEKR